MLRRLFNSLRTSNQPARLLASAITSCAAGDYATALRALRRAVCIDPNNPEIHFELGRAFNGNGDAHAALASYARALELAPDYVAAYVNVGLVYLAQLGDPWAAQPLFERAIALQPESVPAQVNLGLALQEQGLFDVALAHYERLIEAHPHEVEYRWHRALVLLAEGDFARGWEGYQLRNMRGDRSVAIRRFPFPDWDGSDLAERQILIYAEQGLGDEIMFASCLPDVLRQARGVVIECDQRLEGLYKRSFPQAHVHGAARYGSRDWLSAFPEIKVQCAVGSLPRFLRHGWKDFPPHHGYLVVEARARVRWQTRLAEFGGTKPKIGLCWRGGTRKTRDELRSLMLADCLPLLQWENCELVCLQRGDCSDEISALRAPRTRLHWWPEVLADIDETATLISALDLVITIDSAIAHLAGALGKPSWTMLPASPDWRYLREGQSMPWYPSMRLFRQTKAGAWGPLITDVATQLQAVAFPR